MSKIIEKELEEDSNMMYKDEMIIKIIINLQR
jgi:hypothetical protein